MIIESDSIHFQESGTFPAAGALINKLYPIKSGERIYGARRNSNPVLANQSLPD
jgi:hypothetical protein